MPETDMNSYSYWVVRYTPNLLRDEWLNVGVMLLDPGRRFDARFIEENAEFGRVRRLHPSADETVLRALGRHFQSVVGGAESPAAYLAKLGDTLSNVVQLSPEHGLLAQDFDAELDRLYERHVAPPPRRPGAAARFLANSRAAILARLGQVLRGAGLGGRLERRVRIDEFTYKGDPLRLDYGYRRNGTRGFVHALSLEREAAQAKVIAYTAERMRRSLASTEFTVITETAPLAENERHQFVAELLGDQQIAMVPLAQVEPWVNDLRSRLIQ